MLKLPALALVLLAAPFAHASTYPAPVPVSQWKPSNEPITEVEEESSEELRADLQAQGLFAGQSDMDQARVSEALVGHAGSYIIRIHKSHNPRVAEYLEVNQQMSEDPNDFSPVMLFDNSTSNMALVSTAGVHVDKKTCQHDSLTGKIIPGTCKKRQFLTPSGTFSVDWQEKMHISHTYEDAPMPWSTFFAWSGAVAMHGATPNEFKDLGRNASHGCVRLHPDNAKFIFDFVKAVGKENVLVQVL